MTDRIGLGRGSTRGCRQASRARIVLRLAADAVAQAGLTEYQQKREQELGAQLEPLAVGRGEA